MNELLAEREIEILQLVAEGLTNGEVANRLSLSLNTVKWYSKRIFEKLGVESRTQAIKRAQDLGLFGKPSQPQTASQPVYSLPLSLTTFVGRRNEIDAVKKLLKQYRLLTLTGPGGIGKTRLSLQVAEEMTSFFPDGLCFVDLSPITDAALVPSAIARPLGVMESVTTPLTTLLQATLRNKRFLLILDNFEHLLDAVPILSDLLSGCSDLTMLVTSRERLALYGEQEYSVPPLQLPDLEWFAAGHLPATGLRNSEALQLFEHSAQAVLPSFQLTEENSTTVASICLRLDGLPLAIELAAAYVKLLSPQAILSQLDSMWLEMKRGLRNVPARQQTLRNAIEWSYRFLNQEERQLFAQLALFRGGCTWESISAICTNSSPIALLESLNGLVTKSLVWRRETTDHQPRFGMLETIHQYALEQLQSSDEVATLQQRHASYFLQLAEEAAPQLITAQLQPWLLRLDVEHANLRLALSNLLAAADSEKGLRLATALYRFWEYRGYVSEGHKWLQQALAQRGNADSRVIAEALMATGWLAYRQGNLDQASSCFAESLQLFEQTEEQRGVADASQFLAIVDTTQGNCSIAQQRMEQSLQLSRQLNYEYGIAAALYGLGTVAWDQDRFTESRDYYLEALGLLKHLGYVTNIASCSLNLGNAERMLGNLDAAHSYFDEALAIAQELNHPGLTGASYKNLSLLTYNQNDLSQARFYGEEALRIFRQLGDKSHIAFALSNLGAITAKFQEHRQSLAYEREALEIMYEIGYKWPIFDAVEDIGELMIEVGQHSERMVRLLSANTTLRQESDIPTPPYRQQKYDRILTALQQSLDDATFHSLWEEGKNMALAQVVAEVKRLSL